MPNQVDSLVAIHHQYDKNVWLFLFIGISEIFYETRIAANPIKVNRYMSSKNLTFSGFF
jgi:hypothetical protein